MGRCLIGLLALCVSLSAVARDLPIKIRQDMNYDKARKILIRDGWQIPALGPYGENPYHDEETAQNCSSSKEMTKFCLKYPEVYSQDPQGGSYAIFFDGSDHALFVSMYGPTDMWYVRRYHYSFDCMSDPDNKKCK